MVVFCVSTHFLQDAPGSVVQIPERGRYLVLVSGYVQARTGSHVLTQVRWQAENGPIILPGVAVQTTRVRGKTSRVGGMTSGGDAAVCRALAADLLELSGGLGGRLAPASLTGGKRLLGT